VGRGFTSAGVESGPGSDMGSNSISSICSNMVLDPGSVPSSDSTLIFLFQSLQWLPLRLAESNFMMICR